jgi:hypothetical protein
MRQLLYRCVNQSCFNCSRVRIIPEFYNTVFILWQVTQEKARLEAKNKVNQLKLQGGQGKV